MKKLPLVALLGATVLLATGCSIANTAPDEAGLHYSGGPFSSQEFKNCINPGTRNVDGPANGHYMYPFGQRTFKFSNDEGSDTNPLSVVSKDQVAMEVRGTATFALNTDCATLQSFHERIGIKYRAWNEGGAYSNGWVEMLNTYLKDPLDKALDAASKKYGYVELWTDQTVKEQWEDEVATLTASFIKDQAGADYFCAPSYTGQGDCGKVVLTIQAPEPPQDLRDAIRARQVAVQQNEAQVERNKNTITALEAEAAIIKALGPEGYAAYKQAQVLQSAIDKGNVSVIPVPQGAGVNVQPK